MRRLKNVTLVAVATTEIDATVKALQYSARELDFDRILFIASHDPLSSNDFYDFIKIEPFNNVGEWGRFVVFELHKYITTDYIILIHSDGFIVNPQSWDDDFLNYDYIGAPWPLPKDNFSYRDFYGNIIRVGNSVSIRSRKLLKMPSDLGLEWACDHDYFHEDGYLCVQNRHIFQAHGIAYAPLSVASKFSHERPILENKGIKPFAFHKWAGSNRHYPRFSKKASLRYRILKVFAKLRARF